MHVDLVLFEQLREWRKQTADAASVPAFVVFTDATLTAIAVDRPTTATELLQIPGIGQVKVDRYGEALLDVVRSAAGTTRRNKSLAWRAHGLVPFPGTPTRCLATDRVVAPGPCERRWLAMFYDKTRCDVSPSAAATFVSAADVRAQGAAGVFDGSPAWSPPQ